MHTFPQQVLEVDVMSTNIITSWDINTLLKKYVVNVKYLYSPFVIVCMNLHSDKWEAFFSHSNT